MTLKELIYNLIAIAAIAAITLAVAYFILTGMAEQQERLHARYAEQYEQLTYSQ